MLHWAHLYRGLLSIRLSRMSRAISIIITFNKTRLGSPADDRPYTDYPKDPQKLTGGVKKTLFVQIALTPKGAGLVWTFSKNRPLFM